MLSVTITKVRIVYLYSTSGFSFSKKEKMYELPVLKGLVQWVFCMCSLGIHKFCSVLFKLLKVEHLFILLWNWYSYSFAKITFLLGPSLSTHCLRENNQNSFFFSFLHFIICFKVEKNTESMIPFKIWHSYFLPTE